MTDLDVDIEEADARFIPHAMHATKLGTARVVLLSSDTDVLVLALYFWCILHAHGLSEMWMRAGVGNTIRYIPLHTLVNKIPDLCKVMSQVKLERNMQPSHQIQGHICHNLEK